MLRKKATSFPTQLVTVICFINHDDDRSALIGSMRIDCPRVVIT